MSEIGERHESEHECQGCGQQFNGLGTLSSHAERCTKLLLLSEPEGACSRCGGWGWIDADPEYSGDCPECKP